MEKDISTLEGHIGDITFSISGPYSKIRSVVNFIRNLVHMSGGYRHIEYTHTINDTQT